MAIISESRKTHPSVSAVAAGGSMRIRHAGLQELEVALHRNRNRDMDRDREPPDQWPKSIFSLLMMLIMCTADGTGLNAA